MGGKEGDIVGSLVVGKVDEVFDSTLLRIAVGLKVGASVSDVVGDLERACVGEGEGKTDGALDERIVVGVNDGDAVGVEDGCRDRFIVNKVGF